MGHTCTKKGLTVYLKFYLTGHPVFLADNPKYSGTPKREVLTPSCPRQKKNSMAWLRKCG